MSQFQVDLQITFFDSSELNYALWDSACLYSEKPNEAVHFKLHTYHC